MTIEISCSNCGEEFHVRDEAAGKSFKCKVCGRTIRIPEDDDEDDDYPRSRRRSRDDDEDDDRPRKRRRNSADVSSRTLGPAIGLYVVAALGLFAGVIRILLAFVQPDEFGLTPPPDLDEAARIGFFFGAFFATVGVIVFNLLVLAGAYCLHTCQGYTMAMFGCVLASIPCCSPCLVLGIPFGIWGLAVLTDDSVKRAFQ